MLRLVVLLIFLSVQVVCAGEDARPIRVTADRLEVNNQIGQIVFQGNVVAGYDDMTLRSEEMTLFVAQDDRAIQRMEAVGQVKMMQGARVATGDSAIFYNLERKIVFSGDAQLKEGDNLLEGQDITVLLDEERTLVGGRQGRRVNAVFHPPGAD